MSFRSAELAVKPQTVKRLRMAIKLYPKDTCVEVVHDFGGPTTDRIMTVDELAGSILTQWILEKFPKVIELEDKIKKLEKEMMQ